MKFNLTIECDDADELQDVVAKLNGDPPARGREEEKEDEPAGRPSRASKKEEDEPARGKKGKDAEEQREEIRALLRDLSEKTDRKTAVKLLNKYADSVDDVKEDELKGLKDAVEAAIEKA